MHFWNPKIIRYCECCGMLLEYYRSCLTTNERRNRFSRFCQWCFDNGSFVYQDF
ncbi:zinc ribbon domain-containing protein [Dubosiella newyorkensis]|uniref:zinc ribbon domain-containing protein n=1 Tax=Dubosiella newyorkensis TaxID=1862672 RepID=UPI003F67FFFD